MGVGAGGVLMRTVNAQAGGAPGSAVTTAATPRPASAPARMPQGTWSARATASDAPGPEAPAKRDSQRKRVSVSTYTPWHQNERKA